MPFGRVLVVEDDDNVRNAVRLILAKAGYEVIEAADGGQAMGMLASGDNPTKVVTIICDLKMPKVGGIEAIRFFRSHFPSIPVIVLTVKEKEQETTALLRKEGVVNYLIKPIAPERLTAAVLKATKERASET